MNHNKLHFFIVRFIFHEMRQKKARASKSIIHFSGNYFFFVWIRSRLLNPLPHSNRSCSFRIENHEYDSKSQMRQVDSQKIIVNLYHFGLKWRLGRLLYVPHYDADAYAQNARHITYTFRHKFCEIIQLITIQKSMHFIFKSFSGSAVQPTVHALSDYSKWSE